MAVFLLKTRLGSAYDPPDPVGIFADVAVGDFAGRLHRGPLRPRRHRRLRHGSAALLPGRGQPARGDGRVPHQDVLAIADCTGIFTDVPCTPGVGFPDWIEQLYAEQVTGGCIANSAAVLLRAARSRAPRWRCFLLKTKHGNAATRRPLCSGLFADVPCPGDAGVSVLRLGRAALRRTGDRRLRHRRRCATARTTPISREMAVFLTTKTFPAPLNRDIIRQTADTDSP